MKALHRAFGLQAVAGFTVATMIGAFLRSLLIGIVVLHDQRRSVALQILVERGGLDLHGPLAVSHRPLAAHYDLAVAVGPVVIGRTDLEIDALDNRPVAAKTGLGNDDRTIGLVRLPDTLAAAHLFDGTMAGFSRRQA